MTTFNTALSYEYLTSFNNVELQEIEALCIATQDHLSLQRIARIREWRAAENRSAVAAQPIPYRPEPATPPTVKAAAAQIEVARCGFTGAYSL